MTDWMVDGLGDRLVNWLAIAHHPGASFEWQRQHAAAEVKQDALVAAYILGGSLDPPCHIVGYFLDEDVGHGLHQRRGIAPRPQH